jgi:hypothetical protein
VGVWGICVVGGHAPRLRSRPERASDMHPQAPNIQTFLPACLLPTACDYNGLDCFDPLATEIRKRNGGGLAVTTTHQKHDYIFSF